MPRPLRATPIDRLVAKTLKEIAEELGCTPQAVRATEKNALEKIRRALVARGVVTAQGRYSAP